MGVLKYALARGDEKFMLRIKKYQDHHDNPYKLVSVAIAKMAIDDFLFNYHDDMTQTQIHHREKEYMKLYLKLIGE